MLEFLRKLQREDEEADLVMWRGNNALLLLFVRLVAMVFSWMAGACLFGTFNLGYWLLLPLSLVGYFAERALTSIAVKRLRASESRKPTVKWWEFLSYLIPRKARQEIYDNLIDEVRIDWIEAKAKSSSRTWLFLVKVAFGFRILWYFLSTLATALSSAGLKLVVEAWKNIAG